MRSARRQPAPVATHPSGQWAERLHFRGRVHGPEFLETVLATARHLALRGHVQCQVESVVVVIYGTNHERRRFLHQLVATVPPAVRVSSVERCPAEAEELGHSFELRVAPVACPEEGQHWPATCDRCRAALRSARALASVVDAGTAAL